MLLSDGRHSSEIRREIERKRQVISCREWLLPDLNPDGAGPMGARLQKLYKTSKEELELYRPARQDPTTGRLTLSAAVGLASPAQTAVMPRERPQSTIGPSTQTTLIAAATVFQPSPSHTTARQTSLSRAGPTSPGQLGAKSRSLNRGKPAGRLLLGPCRMPGVKPMVIKALDGCFIPT